MDVTFRPATADDLAAVIGLLADDPVSREREGAGGVTDRHRQAFADIAADARQRLLVAEVDGAVVGSLQVTFIPGLTYGGGERCQLEAVHVDSSTRGAGVGTRLVEHAIELARARGCAVVQLTSDKRRTDAIRFYETLGFTASHEGLKLQL
ncbi:MAG: family acetyltransferase [Actinomycetia bacterium]|nr:family acetyltransferase [Actinomycetes bacterium]